MQDNKKITAHAPVRRRMSFHGEVQGVGFRFTATQAARMYGCTGWCRNEYDGTVTMEIQGTDAEINAVVATICKGKYIVVDRIDSEEIRIDTDERQFGVK
ncbi:MAG: acylphosphatase [Eubacterium sp.]|nr:acylphosphatase [Eubacterium sp.]